MTEFDIVIYGVSGFAGKLVAEYMVQHAPKDLVWAAAGRDEAKVRAALDDVGAASSVPIIVADSNDVESLHKMAKATRVVCSTVGPYARYGSGLVAACVDEGVDYCDLTGEVHWMRRMIDRHHERAQESGARIVHTCGFDSIPSDLGNLFVQDAFKKKFGRYATEVRFYLKVAKGGFSGGTVASMLNLMEEASENKEVRRILVNPYSLSPGDKGPDGRDRMGAEHDARVGQWTAPFLMGSVNTRVVRRSNFLMNHVWGENFSYDERMLTGKGPKGAIAAGSISAGMVGFTGVAAMGPTRNLLSKFLPKPGEGPTPEQIEKGFYEVLFVAKDGDDELQAKVAGKKDPGYGATALMLAESAMELAQTEGEGGVLTPASSMGVGLIQRLQSAGMVFEVL